MKISILGYGEFGSAMGSHLSKLGHSVYKDEVKDSEVIFIALLSFAVKDVLAKNKNNITNQKLVICSKGFSDNGELLSVVVEREFPNNQLFFLYGPTVALGITNGEFSGMVLAGHSGKEDLKREIESDKLHIELSEDIVGVQIGAIFKNAVNIFIGLVEGRGLGLNTEAYVFAKGLEYMMKTGLSLGAKESTFLGLSGAGDLYLRSRSRELGVSIGKGKTFSQVDKKMDYPKEGIFTLRNLDNISKFTSADLSFFRLAYSVIFEDMKVEDAVRQIK